MDFTKSTIAENVTRVVEYQSYNSTRQLVDSDAEQKILEQLIDQSKPPYPQEVDNMGYLLKTPFRYPPLPYGSRFGNINEPGIFYSSLEIKTALCETAYYRFRFLFDSDAKFRPSFIPYTSFAVGVYCKEGLNLTKARRAQQAKISNPITYKHSQAVGKKARSLGIKAILYNSAREENGNNVAIFAPKIFTSCKTKHNKHWNAYVDYNTVTFTQGTNKPAFVFPVEKFMVKGIFPII